MRLVAFLQLFNENETGNLVRCLENCKRWADDIYIYDDCSTDGSQEVYKQYTEEKNIIHGELREFNAELFHKQKLLDLVLKTNPDWIGWIDGDTELSKYMTENAKDYLADIESRGHDGSFLHNVNLWRHPAYYRADNRFNGLWHTVFWKNNGKLHYSPVKRLHQRQYPIGMENVFKPESKWPLVHYGFASKLQIVKKYLTYKSYGQHGDPLDRLIDERTLDIYLVPPDYYPNGTPEGYNVIEKPQKLTYDEYRNLTCNWEEFKLTKAYEELRNE